MQHSICVFTCDLWITDVVACTLQNVLESGVKKSSGDMTASLFLSKKLERWHYGFEYGALEVKSHLERVLFSDIISSTMIR